MKKYTNYSPGLRGITVNSPTGPSVHWIEAGQSASLDPKDVLFIPDLGKPGDASANNDQASRVTELEAENARLTARVTELEAKLDAGDEPGPLDQSVEKLTAYLETVTDADEVDRLAIAERAGKSRTGAITALEARRDALLA